MYTDIPFTLDTNPPNKTKGMMTKGVYYAAETMFSESAEIKYPIEVPTCTVIQYTN